MEGDEGDIRVGEVVYNETVWTAPIVEKGGVYTSLRESESAFITNAAADSSDIIEATYERTNEKRGHREAGSHKVILGMAIDIEWTDHLSNPAMDNVCAQSM